MGAAAEAPMNPTKNRTEYIRVRSAGEMLRDPPSPNRRPAKELKFGVRPIRENEAEVASGAMMSRSSRCPLQPKALTFSIISSECSHLHAERDIAAVDRVSG
jgi:hypothetical protein